MIAKINHNFSNLRVLVAPLDWGMGHATRCIPIINLLLQQQIKVFVAVEGPLRIVMEKEVPACTFLHLRGYNVQYAFSSKWFFAKLLLQIPHIAAAIAHEKRWLQAAVAAHGIQAVISDNRFGLSHPGIPCAYVTHQLHIETGYTLLNKFAQRIHYQFINNFNQCWVPDFEAFPNLAGVLAHPKNLPKTPVTYLGPLSRFTKTSEKKQYDVLILLSGPEPQRTKLEHQLLLELPKLKSAIVFVRGLPGKAETPAVPINVKIYNYVHGDALSKLIQQSRLVVARSGYSTVMDLAALRQAAVLIPTPGQTEQQYLGKWLQNNGFYKVYPQETFSIAAALDGMEVSQNLPRLIEPEAQREILLHALKKLLTN